MSITFADAAEATRFLLSREASSKALRKMTKTDLVTEAVRAGLLNPRSELVRWRRDELINAALEHDYPIEAVNLAIHVRTHTRSFPDCPHCQFDADESSAIEQVRGEMAAAQSFADHTAQSVQAIAEASGTFICAYCRRERPTELGHLVQPNAGLLPSAWCCMDTDDCNDALADPFAGIPNADDSQNEAI